MNPIDNASYLPKILKMFRFYGCEQQTLISKAKLTQILNKQAHKHLGKNYPSNPIQQFWQQSQTTSSGQSTALTYSKVINEAMQILQSRIDKIENPQGIISKQFQLKQQQNKLQQLQRQYQAGQQFNYNKINICRKNIATLDNHIMELKKNLDQFNIQLKEIKLCLQVDQRQMERTQIIIKDSNLQQSVSYLLPSPHLDLLFKITITAICLQLFILNYHPSFLPLLCYLLIIFFLFLGYFDHNFVTKLVGGVIISILLDISYVVMQMLQKAGNYRYRAQTILAYISMVIIVIEIALRIVMIIKLCHFIKPKEGRQFFILFNTEIQLNLRSGINPNRVQRNSYFSSE